MINSFKKLFIGILFLGAFSTANSTILKVETLASFGAGSLNDQISAAASGDTILINIKGTIQIGIPVFLSKTLTIIGPTASHCTIDAFNADIRVLAGGNLTLKDVRITKSTVTSDGVIRVGGAGATLRLINCVFENITTTTGGGAALFTLGTTNVNIDNCTFNNCNSGNQGGAIEVLPGDSVTIRNCTFYNCTAANGGGAIAVAGSATLINNTFLNNTATTGGGHAVKQTNATTGNIVTLLNNIITDVSSPKWATLLADAGGGPINWFTAGGNVFSNPTYAPFLPNANSNDRFSEPYANIGLRLNPITDGYGLKYFTIISQSSVAVDNGINNLTFLGSVDCRRAPRILYGDSSLDPDAGAVEFTPFTATATIGSSFISQYDVMNNSVFPGPKYMDFDITGGGPVNYSINATLYNDLSPGVDWMVDGFTQDGSIVPGPGITAGDYTPGNYQINIISNSADIFHIDDAALNSFIAGLWIDNGGGYVGITSNNGELHIYGNHIISSAGTGAGGIRLTGANSTKIGGELHYCRNVIGNQVNVGVHSQNNYVEINGNFIGTTATGLATLSNDKGIILQGSFGKVKGRMGLPSMNLISGNLTAQIEIASGNFDIKGNIIGPDVTGNNIFAVNPIGISAANNTGGNIGGSNPNELNVIGGNSDGILLISNNTTQVLGNFIGISPDAASNFPTIPNVTGVHIINTGDFPNIIGDGSLAGRNYIAGNSNTGIHIEDAQGQNVMGNFIGVKPNNTVSGNSNWGIRISGLTAEGSTITGNLISGNATAGIDANATAGAGNISGNKIGTDSTGMVAFPNGNGISITATPTNSQIIGNLISGNSLSGVILDGSHTTVQGNIIGLSMDTSSVLANTQQGLSLSNISNVDVFENYISGNGQNGIIIGAGNSNWIHGNYIGTNRVGANLGNQLHGIAIFFTCANNQIGGPAAADQNRIMYNLGAGIDVERETSVNAILGNYFAHNGIKGILLGTQTVPTTPLLNDVNDVDVSGPAAANVGNNGQNYPVLTSAVFSAGSTTLLGTVNVNNVTADYKIQVYKVNPGNIDATGHGEGDTLVAQQTINAGGLNTFNINLVVPNTVLGDILSVTCSKVVSVNFETSEFSDTIMVRSPFTADASVMNDVSCFGGTDGTVTVTHGGTAPFSYDWINVSTGLTTGQTSQTVNLPAGTYFCSVTDIGSTVGSDTIVVTEPLALSVSSSSVNPICFGGLTGSIDVTPSGGTGPYTFDWSNDGTGDFDDPEDLSGVGSGTYSLNVLDANGCTFALASINLIDPPQISITANVTHETCDGLNDGGLSVDVNSGGTAPYNANYYDSFSNFIAGTTGMNIGTAQGGVINIADGNYTIEMIDANGCIDIFPFTVNPGNLVNASWVNSGAACLGNGMGFADLSTASPSSITAWLWDFGDANSSTAQNPTHVYSAAGTFNVSLTVTDGTCSDIDVQVVTVNPSPTVNVGLDSNICFGSPYTQTATVTGGTPGYSFSWFPNTGHFVNPSIEDAVIAVALSNTLGSFTHSLVVTDINGCTDADTMILTVNALPTVTAPSDYSLCSGSPTTLSGTGTATTYAWDNSVIDGNSFNPSATLTYTVTGTSAVGCQNTDQVTITVIPSPVAIAGLDNSICSGQLISLDGSASTGYSSVTWFEVGASSIASSITTAVNPTVSTDYALQLIFGSCVDSDTVTITVISAPDATFGYSGTLFCENSSNPTITTLMTPGGTFTMPLAPGNINSTTGEISMTTLGPGTYEVIYTLTTPCFADDTITITILSLPTVDAGNDTSVCSGSSVNLNGISSGTNYTWSNFAGFFSNTNPTTDTPTASDTYTLFVTDANGCSNTDTKVVTVNTIPTGTISGGGAFCEGDPNASLIVVANGYSGGGDWDVQFYQNSTAGATATPPTGTYVFAGISNIGFNGVWTAEIIDNTTGCVGVASGSVTVTVNPEPNLGAASPFNVCSGVGLFDMNLALLPDIAGGTWTGTGVSGINFNPSSVGVGSFNVVYTLSTGCNDTIQIDVIAAPNPTITGLNSAYCVTDAPFMPSGTPAGGIWSVDGATFGPLTSIDPSSLTPGTHTLSYQFTDGTTSCVGTTNPNAFVVSAVPLDPIAVSNTNQSICAGTSLVLSVTNPNTAGTSVQWYDDVALTNSVGSSINFTTPALTNSIVYYAVIENVGCSSNSIAFNITVNNAQVSAGPDLTICPGTPAQLNVTAASGTISWSPGISLDDSTIQNPLATPNVNTTYVVTVTSGPCSDSDSVNVIIDGTNPDCGITPSYNAFSPDFDGVNDTWIIDAIYNHPDNTVTIFNRWGDKLVSFEDYDNVTIVWDGTYNDNLLPTGTYFYVIEYHDINMQVSGWLQLTH